MAVYVLMGIGSIYYRIESGIESEEVVNNR